MSKILIHAGLHKTGTSAIQEFLFDNKDEIFKYGFFYPNMKPFKAHHKFAGRLKSYNTKDIDLAIKDVNRTIYTLSDITTANCLVLSSEILSEGVNPVYFKYLNQIFTEIEFHFYIRRQDELLESAYNQQVKQRPENRKINEFKPYFTDIYQHLFKFKRNIPDSKVYAHVYDKQLLKNRDVTEDFSTNVLGINNLNSKKSKKIINESLSSVGCLIMLLVNSAKISENIRIEILNYLFQELPSNEYKFYKLISDKDEEELFSQLKESNRLLDKEFLGIDYMSNLEPRLNKTYLSLQDAFDIAEEKGVIKEINAKYNLNLTL